MIKKILTETLNQILMLTVDFGEQETNPQSSMVGSQKPFAVQGERRATKTRLCSPPSPPSQAALAPACRYADASAHPQPAGDGSPR